MRAVVTLWLALAGCGDNIGAYAANLAYAWDDRRVLCSQPIDDAQTPLNFSRIVDADLRLAHDYGWVAIMHAHSPGVTIARDTLDRVLSIADSYDLAYVTFRDLDPAHAHAAGLALAFDDSDVDAWFSIRDLLASHSARVTFFVSMWQDLTPIQLQELAILAGDGHDIEPHSVNHVHGPAYVTANGIDAYIANEVLPSFQVIVDAGYPAPSAFAYPFGDRTPEIDAAVLAHVAKVRTTPGPCPY